MTTFDPQVVNRRLAKLQEIVVKLETERPRTPEELAKADVLSDATFYRVQVGIETVIDIGGHILAEIFQKRVDSYKDTIDELGKKGVVPEDFAKENADMVDFRNILVHHYVEIDAEKAFVSVDKAPKVLREFAEYIGAFLEKTQKSECMID